MQRFRDWLHEREIVRLSTACKEAYTAGLDGLIAVVRRAH